jgi:hypothetical protein
MSRASIKLASEASLGREELRTPEAGRMGIRPSLLARAKSERRERGDEPSEH